MDEQQDAASCGRESGAASPSAAEVFQQQQRCRASNRLPAAAATTAGFAAEATYQEQQRAGPPEVAAEQQQHQQAAWLAAWQEQASGSSGSGGSLGQLLGQVNAGYPASDTPTMDVTGGDQMLSSGSWQLAPSLAGSRAPSALDVLGRVGVAAVPQQLPRQLSMPTPGARLPADISGLRQAAGLQFGAMSLPASPTMLQHQLQQSGHGSGSVSHSISPSSGDWPDIDMEQPLAPQLAGPVVAAATAAAATLHENGENGDALLWHSSQLAVPSSSVQSLQQQGVPLGLQLRLSGALQQQLAAAAAAGSLGERQPADAAMLHQPQQRPGMPVMLPQLQQQQQQHQRLHDQALMPPPLPMQPGSAATRGSMLSSAPRPPPLIIPSTQPHVVQPLQHPGPAPIPSPAQPRSGTSMTPAMLSMDLADCAAAVEAAAAAALEGSTAAARTQEGAAGSRMRRQRRRASVPSSPAGAAAAAATPPASSGAAALLAAGRQHVKVVCGSLHGWLDLKDCLVLVAAGQGVDEVKVHPSAFESLAGKGATRKWRQSLTVLPDGPHDVLVPQPLALGEFLRQHQLEKSSVTLQMQGRSSSVVAAAAEEASFLSPAAVRYQHHSLVSPGVRRRRQQHGSQGSSSQEQDWDAGEGGSDDQLQAHVKRPKGSKAQQQQQQQYWQDPTDPAFQAAMLATLPALQQQRPRQRQQQLLLPADQGAHSTGQLPVPQQDLQALIAGVPAAAAASSLSSGGCQDLPVVLQQQPQQWQLEPGAQPASAVLPLPGLHWCVQSPQLIDSIGAAREEQAALEQPSGGTSAGPRLEQLRPAVRGTAPEPQQQLHHQAALQQQDTSRQASADASAADAVESVASAQQLLSPAGRPIRQLALSRQRAAAAAAAAVAARYERGSQPIGYMGGIRHLQVWCDQLPGMLDLQRMQVVPQQGESEGHPMSLSAFEHLGGRGAARKWRRSLTTLDGDEAITLGEWLERYQVVPGAEGKHVSPKPSQKPRASTPPAGLSPAAAAAAAKLPAAAWQAGDKDQQDRQKQQVTTGALRPGVLGQVPPAQQEQSLRRRDKLKQWQHNSVQPKHVQQASPKAAAGLLPMPAPAALIAPAATTVQKHSSPRSSPAHMAAAAGTADVRRRSRDTGGRQQLQCSDPQRLPLPDFSAPHAAAAQLGTQAGMGPAVCGGTSAEPLNAELLLMLNEYASEYSHPELHLHPAQVEQDLEDLTAVTAGVLSPRLASMDWQHQQHQQQQQQQQQQPIGTAPAAVPAAQLPEPLFQSGLAAAAAAEATSYATAPPHAAIPPELTASIEGASHAVLAPVPQDASSKPTQK